jgi:uncharacterized OsmC-like protein
MTFEAGVGGQWIATDPTQLMGGQGSAPTPPDPFVPSIGACSATVVAHNCEKQGISAEGLLIETAYEKNENPAFQRDFKVVRLREDECGERHDAVARGDGQCIIPAPGQGSHVQWPRRAQRTASRGDRQERT